MSRCAPANPGSIAELCKYPGSHIRYMYWSLRDVQLHNGFSELHDVWYQTSWHTALTQIPVSDAVYYILGGSLEDPLTCMPAFLCAEAASCCQTQTQTRLPSC